MLKISAGFPPEWSRFLNHAETQISGLSALALTTGDVAL